MDKDIDGEPVHAPAFDEAVSALTVDQTERTTAQLDKSSLDAELRKEGDRYVSGRTQKNRAIANLYAHYRSIKADTDLQNALRTIYAGKEGHPKTFNLAKMAVWVAFEHNDVKQRVSELSLFFEKLEKSGTSPDKAFKDLQLKGLRALLYKKPDSTIAEEEEVLSSKVATIVDQDGLLELKQAIEKVNSAHMRPSSSLALPVECQIGDQVIQIVKRTGLSTYSSCWIKMPIAGSPCYAGAEGDDLEDLSVSGDGTDDEALDGAPDTGPNLNQPFPVRTSDHVETQGA